MKRLLLAMATLAVVAVLVSVSLSTTQGSPIIEPVDYCDLAQESCVELQFAVNKNCQAQGNDYQTCKCRDLRAYNACMSEWGCPGKSEQFMLDEGCGPD